MNKPKTRELATLFEFLDHKARDLQAVCRWLILGPDLATAILAEHARPPTVDELTTLVRLLQRETPELVPVGLWLVEGSVHAEAASVELQLDRLIAAVDPWQHPTQILGRLRVAPQLLLDACIARRRRSHGSQQADLEEVEAKLDRAVQIAVSVKKRRRR